ncbi:MAG: molybdopterin molybdotransferase MoeA [Coriobacteriales bacterium]|nr:molybdopterin molybdotransferase MoeA [Coriobacteriales bacterium]
MPINPDDRISVSEALVRVLENVSVTPSEVIPTAQALGRVLAQDIISDINVSPFASSAMDGYAVLRSDLESASEDAPVELRVIAAEGAGGVYEGEVTSGCTVRIMTGAPVPPGADAVIKYEIVDVIEGDGGPGSLVAFKKPAKPNENVRGVGEEFKEGDVVLKKSTTVNPYAMGLIASAGYDHIEVYKQPVVGVFSIGSELVDAPQKPPFGKIRNCNTPCLAGLAQDAGARVVTYQTVPDDPQLITNTLNRALAECDMVITAGGASKGDYDYINSIITGMGTVFFSYMSLKPGKRQTFGIINGTPIFGLSGNPAAAAVGFELLIRPALRKMQGFANLTRTCVEATILHDVKKRESRAFYNRGLVNRNENNEWVACEYGTQSSALLGDLERCNCLIVLPEDCAGLKAGDKVSCMRIDIPEGAES